MNNKLVWKGLLTGGLLMGVISSCTDLDAEVFDQVEQKNFWQTPEQITAGIGPAYASLRGINNDNSGYACGPVFQLQEVTSDEIIVPTRGSDWYDNGNWQSLWLHTWTPNLGPINDAWEFIYRGVARINLILQTVNDLPEKPAGIEGIQAELKTLRAFYYYIAMDLYGNIPVVADFTTDVSSITNQPRAQVFQFIEKDIKDNLPFLTDVSSREDMAVYGRVNKWFAFSILAKLYLNAQVYTGTPRWQDCIAACDSIINAGKYTLEADFFSNFSTQNEGSEENIFVIPFDDARGLGRFDIQLFTLHYQSNETFGLGASPYNGWCTPAAFYNQYEAADTRRQMFLVGQQYDRTGAPQSDKQVNLPLSFNPNVDVISSSAPAFRMAGARSVKYEPTPGTTGGMNNDFAIFRLADIYLMRGEAKFRNNIGDKGLSDFNMVRARAFGNSDHNWTPAGLTLDSILAERGRELAWEGSRRTDMIRFGKFLDPRVPAKQQSPPFRTLFPIPKPQLDKNSKLNQNDGYPR